MRTIALAAAKGGVGKTTLAAALGVVASGVDPTTVALVDLDPQGSLTRWWNDRSNPAPILFSQGGLTLHETKRQAGASGITTLFLDCPPSFSTTQKEAITVADLVLIPVQPSALDLSAVASTVAMVEGLGVPYRFILNRAIFRSRIAGDAVTVLRELGNLAWPPIHQRVAIPQAMTAGQTATEFEPAGRAAAELQELWRTVDRMLAQNTVRQLTRDQRGRFT
jgi:chromosome partitioning protein